jgi:hypothetical protein
MAEEGAFTQAQQAVIDDLRARLAVCMRIVSMLGRHADSAATAASQAVSGMRRALVARALVSDAEIDAAIEAFQAEESALFQLDPEIQEGLREIRENLLREYGPPEERLRDEEDRSDGPTR